jgi:hypothetical protein
MGAIVGTKQVLTELGGEYKLVVLTATVASADDAITISLASHGISAVSSIVGHAITSGLAAGFMAITVAKTSATILTITSVGEDGLAATTFGNISIAVLGI